MHEEVAASDEVHDEEDFGLGHEGVVQVYEERTVHLHVLRRFIAYSNKEIFLQLSALEQVFIENQLLLDGLHGKGTVDAVALD